MYEPDNFENRITTSERITRSDLLSGLGLVGSNYRFKGDLPEGDDVALLRGQQKTVLLRPGLILHTSQAEDLCDLQTSNLLKPGLKIVAVIAGSTEIGYGKQRFYLGPQTTQNHGVVVNLAEPDEFSRCWQRWRTERKISLTITDEWLEEGGLAGSSEYKRLSRFRNDHLAFRQWHLNSEVISLLQSVLQPTAFAPGFHQLQLESRCLQVVMQALVSILDEKTQSHIRQPHAHQLLNRLDELLHSDQVIGMSGADIAKAVASNPTTLQQLARKTWGCSLFERIRAIRMEKAVSEIRKGSSVAEAAQIAGYASATNFSTAFRRCFGHSPSEEKRRNVSCFSV